MKQPLNDRRRQGARVDFGTFDGERLPHGQQLAVRVDGHLEVQQGFVHDERVQGWGICPSPPTDTDTDTHIHTQ